MKRHNNDQTKAVRLPVINRQPLHGLNNTTPNQRP
jgi:hypothetical protein